MQDSRKFVALFCDDAHSWKFVLAILAIFLLGFASFYPQIVTVSDELGYVSQAQVFAGNGSRFVRLDPLTRMGVMVQSGQYPPGTALMMAPFVWLAGWKAAFTSVALCLVAGVLLTAGWLRSMGWSPLFALIIMSFPATIPMSRLAMSDVPSMATVALGLWLFWNGSGEGPGRARALSWLAAGFVAGASSLFRATNVLPFAAFFAGATLRREDRRRSSMLLIGGVAGVALRMVAGNLLYGSAFAVNAEYPFDPASIDERILLYLAGLTIFVPGGLILGLLYRGPRRPEMLIALGGYFLFFLLQSYSSVHSTLPKRIVLALRYFIPLLPLLAFAMAESTPRIWLQVRERLTPRNRRRLTAIGVASVVFWLVGIASASIVVQWGLHRWSASQAIIQREIEAHVGFDSVVVTNRLSTFKYIERVEGVYLPLNSTDMNAQKMRRLAERYDEVMIVILDRSDTPFWRKELLSNAAFVASLGESPALRVDRQVSPTDRLRIWQLRSND